VIGGIDLAVGVCELPTHPRLSDGVHRALAESKSAYSQYEGVQLLRERVASKLATYNNFRVDAATDIVITAGSAGGFATAAMATLDPGDEVILFEPFYDHHLSILTFLQVTPRFVSMRAPDWSPNWNELTAAFNSRTRGVIICTPSNPCGKVFTRGELEKIGLLCEGHNAWIYTDEIYEYFVYDGLQHISMAALDRFKALTITISGFSKTYAVTGWRVGYVAAEGYVAARIGLLNELMYACAPTPLQWGIAYGVDDIGGDFYESLSRDYAHKRDALFAALTDGGFKPIKAQGGFYMLAQFPEQLGSEREVAFELLTQTGVASVPGSAFFRTEARPRMLRFCFAKPTEQLEEACRRLRKFRMS
jgi:aminotransferase